VLLGGTDGAAEVADDRLCEREADAGEGRELQGPAAAAGAVDPAAAAAAALIVTKVAALLLAALGSVSEPAIVAVLVAVPALAAWATTEIVAGSEASGQVTIWR
jgi:hypothetical protein